MVGDYTRVEIAAGAFVLAGVVALATLSVSVAGLSLGQGPHYALTARFSSIGDLREGAPVRLAGVETGEVARIRLADFAAEVELSIDASLVVPEGTIASIRTTGLLGEAYVSLSPGASLEDLAPGGRITRTEPAVDLIDLIGKYAFGQGRSGGDDAGADFLEGP